MSCLYVSQCFVRDHEYLGHDIEWTDHMARGNDLRCRVVIRVLLDEQSASNCLIRRRFTDLPYRTDLEDFRSVDVVSVRRYNLEAAVTP